MSPEDNVILAEEQPLPATVSPTADSPGYIIKSDPEEDPEEEDDEDPKEDPSDYPTERDDKEKEESYEDNANDEEEDEGKDEEEEEHLAPADSIPSPQTVAATLPLPSPPPLPLTSYSSLLPHIPSPPLPISPSPLPASPTHSLGCRAAMIRLRAESPSTSLTIPLPPPIILPRTRASMVLMRTGVPSTYCLAPPSGKPPLLPIPLPTSSLPLPLPSTDRRSDVPEVTSIGGFRADYGFVGTLDAEIRRDLDREVGYGITDVWVDPDEIAEEIPATDMAELGQRMTDFVTTIKQDTEEIYVRLDDAHDDRSTEMVALQSHQRPARDPAHPNVPEEASRVADVLEERDATRSRNGKDSHDPGTGVRRTERAARECTYPDFMKCQPLNFKGTEGVVELTQWFKRMETVFCISNCTVENQIKFATCTLLGSALTWWNSHVRTVGHDVAYAMTWTNLKKMITDKYYPRGEIKKLEVEMWNLKVKESDKIEKYVGGLPDMIHGSVMASKPKTMQDALEFATELMDKKISNLA
ncbi:putative reverse transcriptase domain-containing protein [Tanacetum coccineum]